MATATDLPSTSTGESLDPSDARQRFLSALDNDLDTPVAVAALVELSDRIRAASETSDITRAQQTLRELGGLLGLSLAV